MKKIIFCTVLCLSSFVLYCQIYVGAKVGLSPSTFSVASYDGFKKVPNFTNFLAGVMVEYPIIYGLSVQAEFQYVKRGMSFISKREDDQIAFREGDFFSESTKTEESNNGVVNEMEQFHLPNLYENYKMSLNYLENFILVKYEFVGGGSGFYVESGPFFSFGLSGKRLVKYVDKDGKEDSPKGLINATGVKDIRNYSGVLSSYGYKIDSNPFKDATGFDLKRFDVGLAVGGGMYKEMGNSRLYFDLRVLLGLKDINKNGDGFTPIKSRSAQLSVTYLFPIGG